MILGGGGGAWLSGAEKAALPFAGTTLLQHQVARIAPQVSQLAINGDMADQGPLTRLTDAVPGQPGPLAGILAAMDWAAALGSDRVACMALDAPFLPTDLVARLTQAAARSDSGIALARAGGQAHPTFGLWPVSLRPAMARDLETGQRRIKIFAEGLGCAYADFALQDGFDPFFSINTSRDLAAAQARLG